MAPLTNLANRTGPSRWAIELVAHRPTASRNSERRSALERANEARTKKGFYIVRQREDFAELRKAKRFSPGWAVTWTILGVPLPGTVIGFTGA